MKFSFWHILFLPFLLWQCKTTTIGKSNALKATTVVENCAELQPIASMPWLQKINNRFQEMGASQPTKIIAYTYETQTVYWVDDCAENCADSLINVYDCNGAIICKFGGLMGHNSCPDFSETAVQSATIWDNTKTSK